MYLRAIGDIMLSEDGIMCISCAIIVGLSILAIHLIIKGVNNSSKWIERAGIGIMYILFILTLVIAMIYFSIVDINVIRAFFYV